MFNIFNKEAAALQARVDELQAGIVVMKSLVRLSAHLSDTIIEAQETQINQRDALIAELVSTANSSKRAKLFALLSNCNSADDVNNAIEEFVSGGTDGA